MVSRVGRPGGGTMAQHCAQAKTWVKTHYERHMDGVVAKSVMYKHYEDYCRSLGRNIMETSIFGRVVKSVFPDVTIRRLGGRDNLKYYYCGIQAKETSPHAEDNATTTRPKRRLRKREPPTDKGDVHRCLLWLHKNYCVSSDASTQRSDVYDRYVLECAGGAVEPLSMQHFDMVLSHTFPVRTRRGPANRNNHHKFYFGLQERPAPLPLDTVPPDLMGSVENMYVNGKLCYREDPDDDEEDEDDDLSCRSPVSDTSDSSLRDSYTPLGAEAMSHSYYIKTEPVDYSLHRLQLKDEPLDEDYPIVKEEPLPLDLHIPRPQMEEEENMRSSPPTQPKQRKIYKPRFHWQEENEEEEDEDDHSPGSYIQLGWEPEVRQWLSVTLRNSPGACVNRDHLYAAYQQQCHESGTTALPMSVIDKVMFNLFPGVTTELQPQMVTTFYRGVRMAQESPLYGRVEEIVQQGPLHPRLYHEPPASYHSYLHPASPGLHQQSSMDLSPPRAAAPRVSPISLHDEEIVGEEQWGDDYPAGAGAGAVAGPTVEQEDQGTPEVMRDGKYYLMMWLTNNFESVPDSCVLKADAYHHYEKYAKSIRQTPFEMNVFGKIVRKVFPKVSIRRLGGRIKPQYHYCGIAVKSTSELYHHMSGKDPAQRSRKKEIATDNHCAEVVIDWLRSNYVGGNERIIMKSAVFTSYCEYCKSINENPVTLNYFGKLVKHCFPNVEVRKCGGRTEPTWNYFGLVPRGPRPPATNPVPISLSDPSRHSSPVTSHYGSPSMLQAVMGQQAGLAHSPMLSRRSPFPASPGESGLEAYVGGDPMASHYPSEELRRRVLVSPYEPGDVPPDTLYSRSPGDTSAQYSRSPGNVIMCRSPGDPHYCHSPHHLDADPLHPLDGDGAGPHSPADVLYSHSPSVSPGARPRNTMMEGSSLVGMSTWNDLRLALEAGCDL
ncbi:hypothetical protein Pmani_028301 [Petrolisthes manimaculis]|uniref:RFX-type winged-helix domain-containing protein n=1 Tax=Petrolisthes manimaculis TaxID=1843537 RepID=A0AAE1NZS2_9EUCA|nr:hypothetical protein Pmani_028301 [Petrolisthes manimaculis]